MKIRETNTARTPLSKKNFKSFVGNIYFFYRFTEDQTDYELCLEPCVNGFNVALYKQHADGHRPQSVMSKVCTLTEGYSEDRFGQLERDDTTWVKALNIGAFLIEYYFSEQKENYGITT